ncbi:MAG: (4Fe-4S)-binding protein [Gemmatimonadaceae bacterium]|jgi:uncharacterized Fe-S cluster protein YjdI/CDGSH-type Zn-finger protein|nr:(4Fe-4S)-binding protein [Gemmatimonadaceae bacterium]
MARHLQVYAHEGLRVTFEPTRCIHAAECVRHLPAVFDAQARPWIRPEAASAAEIIAIVQRCPSGALKAYQHDASQEITAVDVTVEVSRHGPLTIRGPVTVVDEATGTTVVEDRRMVLCRCGHSARKPFCDGAHRRVRFRDPPDLPA